jgi:O-antigen chain-terminating methyltransferase
MPEQSRQKIDQIMARIREQVRLRQGSAAVTNVPVEASSGETATLLAGLSLPDFTEFQYNLAECNATHAAVGALNPRPSGIHNQLAQFIKKVMRRALTWYTRPLHQFHGAATRTLNATALVLRTLQDNVVLLEKQISGLSAELASVRRETLAVLEQGETLRGELAREQEHYENRVRRSESIVRRLAYQAPPEQISAAPSPDRPDMFASEIPADFGFDYWLFENRFRGKETDVREKQAVYLEYFRERENVVDLGCGRGEFLELLRDNKICARGVETNLDMYLLCRDKRLDVIHQDIFAYLRSVPDESVGGVFCSQVIEHLSAGNQLQLLTLLGKKLQRGAPAVVETINPECLYALARNFFLDPTHVRPVHPEMLQFALQELGFQRVELRFLAPVNSERWIPPLKPSQAAADVERFNRAMDHVNSLLYGHQDYAAIAWR